MWGKKVPLASSFGAVDSTHDLTVHCRSTPQARAPDMGKPIEVGQIDWMTRRDSFGGLNRVFRAVPLSPVVAVLYMMVPQQWGASDGIQK